LIHPEAIVYDMPGDEREVLVFAGSNPLLPVLVRDEQGTGRRVDELGTDAPEQRLATTPRFRDPTTIRS
jgi:hypothetical protein